MSSWLLRLLHEHRCLRAGMAKPKPDLSLRERPADQIRDVSLDIDFTANAFASVLWCQGDTTVLACATVADGLPRWMPRDSQKGWVHAEYSLLPGSTDTRFMRERRGAKGRTAEIERLVARSLRGAVDLEALGPIAITIDCDVLNADGGTRCASICAGMAALRLTVQRLIAAGRCRPVDRRGEGDTFPLSAEQAKVHLASVLPDDVAAVSVGLILSGIWTDLDYQLDAAADVDLNVVRTASGRYIEIQGTGEEGSFARGELDRLLDAADPALDTIHAVISSVTV